MTQKPVPEGWSTNRLGEIAEIAIGGTPARKESKYWDIEKETDNHWVAISDLKSRYIFETEERISDPGVQNSNAKLVPADTLLMSFKLTIGRVAINRVPVYTNEAIAAFHLRNGAVDRDFLYYTLPVVCQDVESDQAVKGKTLNKEKLNRIKLLLPPINEQKKISEILGSVDQAIDTIKQVIGQTRQVKRALMQELLTRGLPGQHTRFKQTPLGEIPEDWEVKKLDDIIKIIDCKHYTPKYVESGYPVIRPRNIKEDGLDFSDVDYVCQADYDLLTDKHEPTKGDIVFSRNASFGVPCYVDCTQKFAIGQDTVVMTFKSAHTMFVFYLLASYMQHIKKVSSGSTFKRINLAEIRKLLVAVPPEKEQIAIANVLHQQDQKIKAEERGLDHYLVIKQALMQVLLTGEKRVVLADQQDELLEVAV